MRAINRYNQQLRNELLLQFRNYRQTTTVLAENKCRYSMLFCILREYVKNEQNQNLPIDDTYQKINSILEQLQMKTPNFMDAASYHVLLTELRNRCYSVPVKTEDVIKLAFARRLHGVLTPTVFSQDVTTNLEENHLLPETTNEPPLELSSDTQMLLNGYYDATVTLLKECTNDSWITSL